MNMDAHMGADIFMLDDVPGEKTGGSAEAWWVGEGAVGMWKDVLWSRFRCQNLW